MNHSNGQTQGGVATNVTGSPPLTTLGYDGQLGRNSEPTVTSISPHSSGHHIPQTTHTNSERVQSVSKPGRRSSSTPPIGKQPPRQTSQEAYEKINYDRIWKNKLYQEILAELSFHHSMTREELTAQFIDREIRGRNLSWGEIRKIVQRIDNTIRPRIYELIKEEGVVTICGSTIKDNGRRAELITIWS